MDVFSASCFCWIVTDMWRRDRLASLIALWSRIRCSFILASSRAFCRIVCMFLFLPKSMLNSWLPFFVVKIIGYGWESKEVPFRVVFSCGRFFLPVDVEYLEGVPIYIEYLGFTVFLPRLICLTLFCSDCAMDDKPTRPMLLDPRDVWSAIDTPFS